MNKIKQIFYLLNPSDFIVIVFYSILTILNVIFYSRIPYSSLLILANMFLFLYIFCVAYFDDDDKTTIWTHFHRWYIVPLVFLSFKEVYIMLRPIRPVDFDYLLIQIDRFLFGGDPTHFLHQIANPVMTEILQIAYATFFFLPIILGIELLLKKEIDEFYFTTFLVLYGFILSYIGYLIVPAIGPRFTLHNFSTINKDLPGLFFTKYLRDYVNAGESIPKGTINPINFVQRDVFPSGHTQMTLIVMYLSVKFKVKLKPFFLVVGTLLIFSTVYLWYHYVIDVIAGTIFMIFTVWSGYNIYNWWQQKRGAKEFRYKN